MLRMEPHLAELSRSIDPAVLGQRMRIARIAAGMTQSQVAGDEASTAYVSRIEDGQRRPEAHLLERMAVRMGTTLEALLIGVTTSRHLELQVALEQAEIALLAGDPLAAVAATDDLLAEIKDHPLADLERDARRLRARAFEACGRTDEAIALLEELTSDPNADGHTMPALISLSRCHRDNGDPARAIDVGQRVAAEVVRLELGGLSESVDVTLILADAHLHRGEIDEALATCASVLTAAGGSSAAAVAAAYRAASVAASRSGSPAAALALARKARGQYEAVGEARQLTRLRTQYAALLLKLDPPDATGAITTLESAEREPTWPDTEPRDRADHHLALARARFLVGDHAAARAQIEACTELTGSDTPLQLAEARTLAGQIAAAEGDGDGARSAYREAVDLLATIEGDRGVAQLWFELATQLDELGERDGARDAYRRAAASTGLRSSRVPAIAT